MSSERPRPQDPVGRDILSGTKWSLAARIVQVLVKGGSAIVLARLLGPADFGVFLFVVSLALLLSAFSDLGMSAGTARLLAEGRSGGRAIVGTAARHLLVTTGVVAAVVFLVALVRESGGLGDVGGGWAPWLVLLLVVQVAYRFTQKVFEGSGAVGRFSRVAIRYEWMPWALAAASVVAFGTHAVAALAGKFAGQLILVGRMAWEMHRLHPARAPEPGDEVVGTALLVRTSLPLLATAASFYVYAQSDIILIKLLLDDEAVGVYGVAVKVLEMLHVPGAALGSAVAAYFVLRVGRSRARVETLLGAVNRSLATCYLPFAVLIGFWGGELLRIVFGGAYAAAWPVLIVYLPYLVAKAYAATYGLALDYLGKAGRRAIAFGLSATCNVALNLVLIPRYGIVGAAVSTQLTYLPLVLWYAVELAGSLDMKVGRMFGALWPQLVAGAAMAGTAAFTALALELPAHTGAPLSVGAFAVTLWLAGGVSSSELRALLQPTPAHGTTSGRGS